MLEVIVRFLRWVFDKCAAATVIVALALAACALWLFLKDNVDFDEWRRDVVRSINGERTKVKEALADVHKRMDRISAEITAEQDRGKQADKVIGQLRELESTWDKLVGNREQQRSNAEQLAKMTELRLGITAKVQALQQEFTRTTWERDGLEIALGKVEVRLKEAEEKQSRVLHYLERAWEHPVGRGWLTLPVKWWVYVTLAVYFLGPTVGKLTMFYLVAPRIARGRPVQLGGSAATLPDVGAQGVSADLVLGDGERLWVREQFLQASDEGLAKQTRALLDWRMPLTCMATRLVELIEMRHGGGGEQRVTLSNQGDPHSELAVVTIPDGASLVLRPSFLAGVALPAAGHLRVRRRWQLFRWQAWVTLQFRYFEFVGPCRLVVAGTRGVRVERLAERDDGTVPARRANQDATIGFTPNLAYRPARAETFWSYFRGMNPLFDDLFEGRGIFLCQQVSAAGDAAGARRFWAGVASGVMKIFGL
ncbi:MAG: hypothetical protein HZA93_14770 [Verrucomicrobia bacterium]|nr:hypothetical protein [Verrucomicrobiota bacterium]